MFFRNVYISSIRSLFIFLKLLLVGRFYIIPADGYKIYFTFKCKFDKGLYFDYSFVNGSCCICNLLSIRDDYLLFWLVNSEKFKTIVIPLDKLKKLTVSYNGFIKCGRISKKVL